MMFLNEYEVIEACNRFEDSEAPNIAVAADVLHTLMQWTNQNSDGWPYWQAPQRASQRIQKVLHEATQQYYRGQVITDLTDAQLRQALSPLKTFLTKQGVKYHADLPWAAVLPAS